MPNWGSVDPVWLKLGSKSKFRMKKTVCSKLNFQKQNMNKPFFLPTNWFWGEFFRPRFWISIVHHRHCCSMAHKQFLLSGTQFCSLTLKLGMKQGLEGQTRSWRQVVDHSLDLTSCCLWPCKLLSHIQDWSGLVCFFSTEKFRKIQKFWFF
jgi:hypothetical protein